MKSVMNPASRIRAVVVLSLLLGLLVLGGCGMKGPPLPPLKEGNVVAAPENLTFTRQGMDILLIWTHTVDPVNAKIPPEAFKVFAAVKSPEQCEGCPFIFNPVGTVPMPRMEFRYTLKEGYRHYFRVQAIGANDQVSKFSETLYVGPDAE